MFTHQVLVKMPSGGPKSSPASKNSSSGIRVNSLGFTFIGEVTLVSVGAEHTSPMDATSLNSQLDNCHILIIVSRFQNHKSKILCHVSKLVLNHDIT